MGKTISKKEISINIKTIIDIITIAISMLAILVSIKSLIISNHNSIVDRRVNVYTKLSTSLDSTRFYAKSEEMGFGKMLISEVDDTWVKNRILEAVEINAELKMYDEESAEKYWKIISHIYGPEHYFDSETYEELKSEIKKELN